MEGESDRVSRNNTEKADQYYTLDAIFKRSRRTFVPLRKAFMQSGTGKKRTPGPLHELVRTKNDRALDLYLLIIAMCSSEPYDCTMGSLVWARAMGLEDDIVSDKSRRSAISRAVRVLKELHLIDSKRGNGRKGGRGGNELRVILLDERGNGTAYERPRLRGVERDRYVKIPYEYWMDGWQNKLTLKAKAVLLIAMSLPENFFISPDMMMGWYGISYDTFQRGVSELEDHGLMKVATICKPKAFNPSGFIRHNIHLLCGVFEHQSGVRRASVPA